MTFLDFLHLFLECALDFVALCEGYTFRHFSTETHGFPLEGRGDEGPVDTYVCFLFVQNLQATRLVPLSGCLT